MNPNLKPEDIDNMVMYERASERRSGAERRNGGLMKNNDLRQAAERSENPQPSAETKFVGEFGYQTPQ